MFDQSNYIFDHCGCAKTRRIRTVLARTAAFFSINAGAASWCGTCLRAVSKVVVFIVFACTAFIILPVVLVELCEFVGWCALWMLRRAVNMFVPCVPPVRGGGVGSSGGVRLVPSHDLGRDGRVWVSGGEARGAGVDYDGDVEMRVGVSPLLADPTGDLPVFDGPARVMPRFTDLTGVPPSFLAGPTEPVGPGPAGPGEPGVDVDVGIGDSAIVRADHRLRVEVTNGATSYIHSVQAMVQRGHWYERRGEYREAERNFLSAWNAVAVLASDELNVCILTGLITSMRKASRTPRPEIATYVCTLNTIAVRTAVTAPVTSLYARVALGSYFSVIRDDARARLHFSRGDDIVKRAGRRDCFTGDVLCALEIGHGQSWMILCKDMHHVGDLEGMQRGRDEEVIPRFERALETCDAPDVRANIHRMLGDVYELFFSPPELGLMGKHRLLLYEGCGRTFPETCAICLEEVTVRDTDVMIYGCLHAVHRHCGMRHTQTRRAKGLPAECSVCRARVELF